MKKHNFIILLFMLLLSCVACSKKDPIGQWDDNIILSQKSATLSAAADSITITTQGNNWWVNGIYMDSSIVPNTSNINTSLQNFTFSTADFVLQRVNGTTIKIRLNANSSGADRQLRIGLQDGNYFDGIVISQLH